MPGLGGGGAPVGSNVPQAPIRGLQRAFQQPQGLSLLPQDEDAETPDRSGLGQRQPDVALQGLMDAMRRFGKVY